MEVHYSPVEKKRKYTDWLTKCSNYISIIVRKKRSTYARNEIFSATEAAKRFGAILQKFQEKSLARAAVSKNNRIEAVILPVEAYEEMKEIAEWFEMMDIAEAVDNRKKSVKTHSLKDVLRENKIDYEAL
jgi:PHD/YefM family antitoxin component YafN of YafNO toxin-antitoxin module